ncbi:MAG: PAS domain-containing sensor histidine kinase [Prevotella sp.]|nr:PAS domain-containing sensor histidine kinase [Prevotella sp.]
MKILILLVVFVIFVIVLISNRVILRRVRQRMDKSKKTADMMLKALEISANEVVRYDVSERYIHKLYGHLTPDEGLSLEEWMKHVHPDDLEEALDWFRQILYNRLKRAEFRYRWNFDYTGRSPRWGYIYNVSVPEYVAGSGRIGSVISTMKDETDLIRQEEEESELTDRYKLIYENSIIGLSFYTPDGWLLDSNKLMREICHFDTDEGDQFFSNTNMFELSPFRECCDPNNMQELWICTQSVVPERNIYDYLEIRLRPIYDDAGVLNYIAIAARNVTEERQMYLQAKLNDIQIQKANAKIKAYEEELRYMMEACDMCVWRLSFAEGTVKFYKGLSTIEREIPFAEMADYFIDAKENVMRHFTVDQDDYFGKPLSYLGRMRPILHAADEVQWNQMNSIPVFDGEGRLTGAFGLIRNITGLMKKQEMLKQETERANDSGRLKSVFLANMTHEIRTPLNAIVGFSDLLQAIDSPDDKKEMIRVIHNNCDMLLRLVNDILVLSSADSNVMEIIPEDIDAAREFDDLCQSLAQRVQEPGVEFIKDNPYTTLLTRLDAARINQVFINFVTNAVKYTHQGHIKVGYRMEERQGRQGFYAYCEDTGSGIPADQQGRIFERFVKLNDFVQGTGLGLSICKAIIEKCDGEIGVDSEEGKGSTFWFWVPATIKDVK